MPRGQGTYGSKRGRPSKAVKSAVKSTGAAFIKGAKASVKSAGKVARVATKGAKASVKAAGKVATSKKLRAGLKAGASAATGLTALRALKKRKKK